MTKKRIYTCPFGIELYRIEYSVEKAIEIRYNKYEVCNKCGD